MSSFTHGHTISPLAVLGFNRSDETEAVKCFQNDEKFVEKLINKRLTRDNGIVSSTVKEILQGTQVSFCGHTLKVFCPFRTDTKQNIVNRDKDARIVRAQLVQVFNALSQIYIIAELLCDRRPRSGPHTHTKRHAGNFLWSWQAEWLVGACAIRTSHFMTFLHEANFRPAYCQWRACELSLLTWQTGR